MDVKRKIQNAINKSMSTNMIIQMKRTNSLKETTYQNSHKKKQTEQDYMRETEPIINSFPKKQTLMGCTGEFYQKFKDYTNSLQSLSEERNGEIIS